MRRFLILSVSVALAGWLLFGMASTRLQPVLNFLGTPVAAAIYFLQYYLWGTATGNILVAASLLLGLSWLLSHLYARFILTIVPSLSFDKNAEEKVVSHILENVGQREIQPYREAIPGIGKLRVLRFITWLGVCGAFVVSWMVSGLHLSLNTGELVGISHATLLFGALCFVMTFSFLVRLYLVQKDVQKTFREGK